MAIRAPDGANNMDNVDENYLGLRHIWLCEYCRTYCWQIISTVSQVRLPMAIGPGSHTSGIETHLPSYFYKRSFSKKVVNIMKMPYKQLDQISVEISE